MQLVAASVVECVWQEQPGAKVELREKAPARNYK